MSLVRTKKDERSSQLGNGHESVETRIALLYIKTVNSTLLIACNQDMSRTARQHLQSALSNSRKNNAIATVRKTLFTD